MSEFISDYKVDFNKLKRCLTSNYCTAIQTKMVKICFDWNKCKLLHKQLLSLNGTGSGLSGLMVCALDIHAGYRGYESRSGRDNFQTISTPS